MKGNPTPSNGKGERQTELPEYHPQSGLAFPDTKLVNAKAILNKEIRVLDYVHRTGKFGEIVIVKCEVDGEKVSFATGSQVLMKQLDDAKQKCGLPFRGIITVNKRYYTFK